ncbi:MAG: hypothetical protein ACSW8H_00825, partial [bacterium]
MLDQKQKVPSFAALQAAINKNRQAVEATPPSVAVGGFVVPEISETGETAVSGESSVPAENVALKRNIDGSSGDFGTEESAVPEDFAALKESAVPEDFAAPKESVASENTYIEESAFAEEPADPVAEEEALAFAETEENAYAASGEAAPVFSGAEGPIYAEYGETAKTYAEDDNAPAPFMGTAAGFSDDEAPVYTEAPEPVSPVQELIAPAEIEVPPSVSAMPAFLKGTSKRKKKRRADVPRFFAASD